MINKAEFEKRSHFYKIAQKLGLRTNNPRVILQFIKQQSKEDKKEDQETTES